MLPSPQGAVWLPSTELTLLETLGTESNQPQFCFQRVSSLFSPSTEEENEREAITVSNTVQVLDFEDERYTATVTMSEQIEKTPVPKVAAKARPKGRPSAPKEKASSSTSPKLKAMPKRVVLKPRKTAQMPWLLKYRAEARVNNVKNAVLKRCKAKTRAKHYAKPDEHITFNALEKAMDRKLAAHEAPKRSLWDHLESHRQACVAALEAPKLVTQ